MQRFLAIATVASLALLLPAASADYSGFGEVEPNTAYDDPLFNEYTPDVTPMGRTLYFNAFITFSLTSVNPNVGALDTAVYTPGNYNFEAMLGVWTDCNGDGYMGLAESAVVEYRSELLVDGSICPPGVSEHNQGGWVTEMIYVGAVDPCETATDAERADRADPCFGFTRDFNPNPRVLYSPGTRIWGDNAAPGEIVSSGFCPLGLLPTGTTSNTGMTIRYFDCFVGNRIANTFNELDGLTGLGIGFDDAEEPQLSPDHPLVMNLPVHAWYNPFDGSTGALDYESDHEGFTTWDCSREVANVPAPVSGVSDPTGLVPRDVEDPTDPGSDPISLTDEDGNFVAFESVIVYEPAPSVDASGSFYDGALSTYDGAASDCDPETRNGMSSFIGDLNPEGDNEPSSANRKENDFTMEFEDGFRGITGFPIVDDELGGENAPQDAGVMAGRDLLGPTWWSSGVVNTGQHVSRATLAPHARTYFTWYASLNKDDLLAQGISTLPSATYGAEHCASIGPGTAPSNGFVCDPDIWWKDTAGQDTMDRHTNGAPMGGVVGEHYQYRDVDCYDGRLSEGAYASLTFTHGEEGVCQRA